MERIATKSYTNHILNKYNLHAKKKFGQNFIIDSNIITKIVNHAGIDQETLVIEIGPGIGALTQGLCEKAGKVVAFEIDEDMVEVLNNELVEYTNLEVILKDFLKVNLDELLSQYHYPHVKIVANLPYYITTKLLEKICSYYQSIDEVIVMIQKDVAIKFVSSQDLKDRLPLTVLMESIASKQIAFDISRDVFNPAPHVDSSIIRLVFNHDVNIDDINRYYRFLRQAFSSRRKLLTNNLKPIEFDKPLVELLNHQEVRAENLSPDEFIHLYHHIKRGGK